LFRSVVVNDVHASRNNGPDVVRLTTVGAATGLMHSDQRQPGSKVIRAALMPPRSTTSMRVLLGVRTSSADPKPFFTIPAIAISFFGVVSPTAAHDDRSRVA
jgi:hypothetical protein